MQNPDAFNNEGYHRPARGFGSPVSLFIVERIWVLHDMIIAWNKKNKYLWDQPAH
jgi:hypothetical protein